GERDEFGLPAKVRAVAVELTANDAPCIERVVARTIDQVKEQSRTLDVAKEAVADAGAFRSALDQARDVRHHELASLVADDAELRAESREWIIAHLCRGVADRVEEGRFSRIRQTEETDVGEQLETQPDPHLLACFTRLVLPGRAVCRALVARVAAAPEAAAQEDNSLSDLGQVCKQAPLLVVGKNLRADRYLDDEVVAAGAGAVGTRAALAPGSTEMLGV